ANGGNKDWGAAPPYRRLGEAAFAAASADFAIGTAGAGTGATTANLKGGLGSASARLDTGITIGALAVVNAVGQATVGAGGHFWAAPFEVHCEFGGLGVPRDWPRDATAVRTKSPAARENTTIAVVATDAKLTKAQAKRLAIMAHDGMAHA